MTALGADHDDSVNRVFTGLRAWAQGLLPLEAAGPWICCDASGQHRIDPDNAAAEKGILSRGEPQVLEVATSRASTEHPVGLSDVICGIDSGTLDSLLRDLAHAGKRSIP